MAPEHTPNRPIKSVGTTFGIIEAINEMNGAGVVELADHLDLAQSTVHAHLSTLVALNYLTKDEGEYHLGLKLLDHGIQARNETDFFATARQEVQSLANEIDEVAWLYTEEYGRGVVIDGANREKGAKYEVAQIGWRPPLHCTSAGKAILAHLPREKVDWVIDRHGLPEMTNHTITSRKVLFDEFETIRERGYATNDEEQSEGKYALGAPFFRDGDVLGAISISGPSYRLSKPEVHESLVDALLETTNEIELALKH